MVATTHPVDSPPSPVSQGPISELIRRRYRYRQAIGIVFGAVIVFFGTPIAPAYQIGTVLIVLGMLVRLWASGHVKKDQVLATTGPYAYVRHPLYVGNHLIAVGLCAASGLWWSLPLWLLLAMIFYPAAIRREDSRLRTRFTEQWTAWRAETHALFPRLRPYANSGLGSWSLKQSMMANGEPIHVVILIGCLYHLGNLLP